MPQCRSVWPRVVRALHLLQHREDQGKHRLLSECQGISGPVDNVYLLPRSWDPVGTATSGSPLEPAMTGGMVSVKPPLNDP